MNQQTTIEKMAADHQDALGGSYPDWRGLDEAERQRRVSAMMATIALVPDFIVFRVIGHGEVRQSFIDAKASLFDEHRQADEMRSLASKGAA